MKTITFKYEENGFTSLGVPDNIEAEKGFWRDGGCYLKFNTNRSSIGIEEPFFIYLYAEDVNKVSNKVWEAYFKTEPERAKEDFKRFVKNINSIMKNE